MGGPLLMLALVAGYLALGVEPVLRYHQSAPPFFLEPATWAKAWGSVEGLVRQGAAGLAQFNFRNSLGTLVGAGLLAGVWWAARALLVRSHPGSAPLVACVPAVCLAALAGGYDVEFERLALGWLAALVTASAWWRAPVSWVAARITLFWGLACAVFYAAGPGALWLFVLIGLARTLAVAWQPGAALGCGTALLLLPVWQGYQPAFDPWAWLAGWGQGSSRSLALLGAGIVPLGLTAGGLWHRFRGQARPAHPPLRTPTAHGTTCHPWIRRRWMTWAALGTVSILFLGLALDSPRKALAQASWFTARQHWSEALAAAARAPAWPARTWIETTRALFHEGRLPDGLLQFPQRHGRELLPDFRTDLDSCLPLSETLLELGQVNLAEHLAHEALELHGPRPLTLRLLARIHVLLGRPEAARVFLQRLRRTPFHRAEADRALQRLAADPAGDRDPQLLLLRGRLPRTDEPESRLPTERLLRQLLSANRTNLMAFEYLAAHHLLSGEPQVAADLLARWPREERRPEANRTSADLTTVATAPSPQAVSVPLPAHEAPPREAAPAPAVEPNRPPRLHPDYAGIVLPPNIAPLNFVIQEPGRQHRVRLQGALGQPIELTAGPAGVVRIPAGAWRTLLRTHAGETFRIEVQTQSASRAWTSWTPITNTVAREPVDPVLVYRRLQPLYNLYRELGIYQRDLESHQETPVLENRDIREGCLNCHSFPERQPDRFALHIRGQQGPQPMLLATPDEVARVNKTAGYLSWHPSGRLLAFSANQLSLIYHTQGETRDVLDAESNLGLYWTDTHAVTQPAVLAQPDRLETWPRWAPDGRHLYFSSARKLRQERFRQVRYDLIRVPFDLNQNTWGDPETVVAAAAAGYSATQPRISPDGRWLVFCQTRYGHFPIYHPGSDLYVLDLETGQSRRLDINSDAADTWPCWSSNSRWLVFSSKRGTGLFARPHFSYVDPTGRFHKPFVLPQGDPTFYDACLHTFNVPELVQGPLRTRPASLARAVLRPRHTVAPRDDTGHAHNEEQAALPGRN